MKDYFLIQKPYKYDVLVNKKNKLPDNYVPADLNLISKEYSDSKQHLRNIAQINFEKMAKDIEK